MKVQCYYSVTNAFQSVSLDKVYCEACYVCRHIKVGHHVFRVNSYY